MRARIIPTLLIDNGSLVKTVKYRNPRYIGDPINAIKIFNDKGADEIAVFDIAAARNRSVPDFSYIKHLADECFMPLSYGGGIRTVDEIDRIIKLGVEKVCINSSAFEYPDLIRQAAESIGSQSVVVSLDVTRNLFGKYNAVTRGATSRISGTPTELARKAESLGAGEILLNSVHRDGTFQGYDLDLIESVSDAVSIPVIASGGAGGIPDFGAAIIAGHASAVAAGSFFVFKGKHRAVLINMPSPQELENLNSQIASAQRQEMTLK